MNNKIPVGNIEHRPDAFFVGDMGVGLNKARQNKEKHNCLIAKTRNGDRKNKVLILVMKNYD